MDLCYFVFVENITISLLPAEESDSERRKRLQKEVFATIRRFRAGGRLTRDQVHDRNALR